MAATVIKLKTSMSMPKNCSCFQTISSAVRSTIFALSSGHGKCGVAVIRVSGPHALQAVFDLARPSKLPAPRNAVLRKLVDPNTGEMLDTGLVMWFPGPASFTGDDCCEFHIHGGPAVITAVLGALGRLCNFQPALPGEFTRRAFLAGRLGLTEVEGLADLINAETQAQRRQALRQIGGHLNKLYSSWQDIIKKCVADMEAFLDFGEEESIEDSIVEKTISEVEKLIGIIRNHLWDSRRGERLRSGVNVTLVGHPNVGKSSLFNHYAMRPTAIVSSVAGTTRDVIESVMEVGGYPVIMSDTAGLRKAGDELEEEGVRRARLTADSANLLLIIAEAPEALAASSLSCYLSHYQHELGLGDERSRGERSVVEFIINKMDLLSEEDRDRLRQKVVECQYSVTLISCNTLDGMDHLTRKFVGRLSEVCDAALSVSPLLTQHRHRHQITKCLSSLQTFLVMTEGRSQLTWPNGDPALATQQLRFALRHLGHVIGQVHTEQILDVIFRKFCIGK